MKVPVTVLAPSGEELPGWAEVSELSEKQAFWRGGRRSAKLIGVIMLAVLPFGVMEPFLFMIWGSIVFLALVLFVGPFMHLIFASETRSFAHVEAACPHCRAAGPLKPYVSTRFSEDFTALCPACGQTTRVLSSVPRADRT
jgi:hypothetical protein